MKFDQDKRFIKKTTNLLLKDEININLNEEDNFYIEENSDFIEEDNHNTLLMKDNKLSCEHCGGRHESKDCYKVNECS